MQATPRSALWLVLLLVPGLGAACRTTETADTTPDPTRPWTLAFMEGAVLVAEEIRIEGPPGLLDHVVLRQDPEVATYVTRTIPDGLLQEAAVKKELIGASGLGNEVRVQLDAWSVAALRKVTVLQRPGDVPLTVTARGKAVWISADGGTERREELLTFRGLPGQGLAPK